MKLTDLNDIKILLARHGFRFSKRMGQNFLVQEWVAQDIAEAAGLDRSWAVLEIGPGIGSLTEQLALRAGRVAAIELDKSLLPILAETMAPYPNVEIIPGDVMKLALPDLISSRFDRLPVKVCANLPYNITTPVITRLLECGRFSSITLMIQREVARRICASPGDTDRGAFSLFCQYHAECSLQFEVPPNCFVPAPKVTSAVVQMIPRGAPPVDTEPELLFSVIRAAFALRRKTLLNCLSAAWGSRCSKDELRQRLLAAGLPETIRGERLSLTDFALLSHHLSDILR